MKKAALLSVAVMLAVTGCVPTEPDFSQNTEAEVRGYCQLQFRVVQQAPITAYTEDQAVDRYVDCIRKGKASSERY